MRNKIVFELLSCLKISKTFKIFSCPKIWFNYNSAINFALVIHLVMWSCTRLNFFFLFCILFITRALVLWIYRFTSFFSYFFYFFFVKFHDLSKAKHNYTSKQIDRKMHFYMTTKVLKQKIKFILAITNGPLWRLGQ